jgi:hypothetical protein
MNSYVLYAERGTVFYVMGVFASEEDALQQADKLKRDNDWIGGARASSYLLGVSTFQTGTVYTY